MTRDEVLEIMGTDSPGRAVGSEGDGLLRTERDTVGVTQLQVPVGATGPELYNPMRTAVYRSEEGTWEVLYYYTRMTRDDGTVTDDELTPIVLLDGRLVGVGWDYWREVAPRSGLDPDPSDTRR